MVRSLSHGVELASLNTSLPPWHPLFGAAREAAAAVARQDNAAATASSSAFNTVPRPITALAAGAAADGAPAVPVPSPLVPLVAPAWPPARFSFEELSLSSPSFPLPEFRDLGAPVLAFAARYDPLTDTRVLVAGQSAKQSISQAVSQ